MKKLIAFFSVIVATVGATYAAAIDWNISGMNKVLSAYDGTTAANTAVYLVLADTTSLASITDATDEEAFNTALANIQVGVTESGIDGKKPSTTQSTVESPKLTSGTNYTFGMLYVSKDTAGNGYYRIVTSDAAAYDTSDPSTSQAVGLSWATMSSAAWSNGWTKPTDPDPGPTPGVPEPATGALALAGVALLFKRRRA